MLKNLDIVSVFPTGICAMLASQVHHVDISDVNTMFKYYDTGVYRHDGFKFNFDHFIRQNCINTIVKDVDFGVCDDYTQVLDYHKELLSKPDKNYVIGLSTVIKKEEPTEGGWRWIGWGPYIGNFKPKCEYLAHEPEIEKVYCYHIYEIE